VSCNLLSLLYARVLSRRHLLLMRPPAILPLIFIALDCCASSRRRHRRVAEIMRVRVCAGVREERRRRSYMHSYTQSREISNKSARRLHQNTKNQTLAPHTRTRKPWCVGKTFCALQRGCVRYNLSWVICGFHPSPYLHFVWLAVIPYIVAVKFNWQLKKYTRWISNELMFGFLLSSNPGSFCLIDGFPSTFFTNIHF